MKEMVSSLIAAMLISPDFDPAKLSFDYVSGSGLTASYDGVPVLRGSFFQYYEGNWARGLYSSNWNEQSVRRGAKGEITVEFSSPNRLASGRIVCERTSSGLDIEYAFRWSGSQPVNVENTVAMPWAPLFEQGEVLLDGKSGRSPRTRIAPGTDPAPRLFGPEGREVKLTGRFLDLKLTTSRPDLIALDGRGYEQDWADEDELFWVGAERIEVAPQSEVVYTASLDFTPKAAWVPKPAVWGPPSSNIAGWQPTRNLGLKFPPKQVTVGEGNVALSPNSHGPIAIRGIGRFSAGKPIREKIGDFGLRDAGFRIKVSRASGIEIWSKTLQAQTFARDALAALATSYGGEWSLPEIELTDYPSLDFRGVHLFIGPRSVQWHERFAKTVLQPLRINHVILQCERTAWDATPGIQTAITTSKRDLARVFTMYRSLGIEPIPLIQSFGHMEWLFANQKNLELAFNREVPYAIDPRKSEARAKVEQIWAEAVALLKPKFLHFGLDEVDMRGFPDDPNLTTELWKIQLPFLASIAKKHGLPMMLWGDKGLAPGEAPDAALGDDKVNAEARRNAIPKGAYITDWHYKNDPRPEIYTSLDLWKRFGYRPIAATWNRHNNIYGFTHAAIQKQSEGVLQTTWAGYEAGEEAMLRSAPQFSSMILTGFYAWSGDRTLPAKLDFDIERLLTEWYFATPEKKPADLNGFGAGKEAAIGPWRIPVGGVTSLSSVLDSAAGPTELDWTLPNPARQALIAMQTQTAAKAGETVAKATITFSDGSTAERPIQYALDVRAERDHRAAWRALSGEGWGAVTFGGLEKTNKLIRSIRIQAVSKVAGLRLGGALTVGG